MIKQIALLLLMVSVYAPLAPMESGSINMQKMNLILAVESHDLSRLQDLFQEYGYNINEPMDRWNRPLLHFAIEHKAIKIVEWLLTIEGLNVDAQSNPGWTALSVSVQKSCFTNNPRLNIPIIKKLLAAGANMHIPSIIGRSPLDIVREDLDDDDPDRATVLHLFGQEFTPKPPQSTMQTRLLNACLAAAAGKQPSPSKTKDDDPEPEPLPLPTPSIANRRARRTVKRPSRWLLDKLFNDHTAATQYSDDDDDDEQKPAIQHPPSAWEGSRRYCPPPVTSSTLGWAAPEYRGSFPEESVKDPSPDAVAAYLHVPLSDDEIAAAAQEHGCYLTEEELAQEAADTGNLL